MFVLIVDVIDDVMMCVGVGVCVCDDVCDGCVCGECVDVCDCVEWCVGCVGVVIY